MKESRIDTIMQEKESQKINLVLATCCAPCATIALEQLSPNYEITLHFWGNNIHPRQEYEKRLTSIYTLSESTLKNKPVIITYEPNQPNYCTECFESRLREACEYAHTNGIKYVATTLTTSPHKDADLINEIGERIAKDFDIKYLPTNFKKRGGFQKSVQLSKHYGLYRQNYCGCDRSRQNRTNQQSPEKSYKKI